MKHIEWASLTPPRAPMKLSLLHSIVFHMLLICDPFRGTKKKSSKTYVALQKIIFLNLEYNCSSVISARFLLCGAFQFYVARFSICLYWFLTPDIIVIIWNMVDITNIIEKVQLHFGRVTKNNTIKHFL